MRIAIALVVLVATSRPAAAEVVDHVLVVTGGGYVDRAAAATWTARVDQLLVDPKRERFVGLRATMGVWGDARGGRGLQLFGFAGVLGWSSGPMFTTIGAGIIPLCIEFDRNGAMSLTPFGEVTVGARLSKTLVMELSVRGERMLRFGADDASHGVATIALGRALM